MRRNIFILTILVFTSLFSLMVKADSLISLQNNDFEDSELTGWSKSSWIKDNGAVTYIQDENIFKAGAKSVAVVNHVPNDSRFMQEIKITPNYYYKLSCWVKTENVGSNAKGANLSVQGITSTSRDMKGTSGDWEYVELYGKAGSDQKSFILTLGLGGYGSLNTGKAWFDNVQVEEFKELPKGANAVNLYPDSASSGSATQNKPIVKNDYNIKLIWILLFYLASVLSVSITFYNIFNKKKGTLKNNSKKNSKSSAEIDLKKEELYSFKFLYISLASAFVLRIMFAPVIEGHPIDMNCFKAWASIASNDLTGFYKSGTFVDYPPVYIYVLYIMAGIAKLFGFISVQWAYTIIIKLPSIIADIVTSYFIFKIAEKNISYKWAAGISALYAFNPVLILNSTIWGQVDSFFTMLIVGALWLILSGRLEWSSVIFCISILMKPQGIIFLPVLFYELIKKKSIREILKCLIYALITAAIVILPFSRDPLWIIKLFLNTASGYKGATINAFNFFALLGANWKDDSIKLFIFSYKTWGFIFDVIILAFSGLLYLKGKSKALPVISSMVLITGAFVMSHRMHERYMFPAMALTLLVYIITRDKRFISLYALSSLTGFINTYVLLELSLREVYWVPANDIVMRITSLINVILMVYMFKISLNIVLRKNQV